MLNPPDVTVTNLDDDTPGIRVNPMAGLVTSEDGGEATFQVRLNTRPTSDVAISVSSSDTGEGTVLPGTLTFTAASWNTLQTVTVKGADDAIIEGR